MLIPEILVVPSPPLPSSPPADVPECLKDLLNSTWLNVYSLALFQQKKKRKNRGKKEIQLQFEDETKQKKQNNRGSHPKKKAAYFWTLSKSGLDPLTLPTRFGHAWGNFCLSRLRKKHTTKNYLRKT